MSKSTYMVVTDNETTIAIIKDIVDGLRIDRTPNSQIIEEAKVDDELLTGKYMICVNVSRAQLAALCKETEDLDGEFCILW